MKTINDIDLFFSSLNRIIIRVKVQKLRMQQEVMAYDADLHNSQIYILLERHKTRRTLDLGTLDHLVALRNDRP